MSTAGQFEVDETTLVFAFRYALGRMSTAPSHMATQLKGHWPRLTAWTRTQIRREIAQAILHGKAGRDCDVETWRAVQMLPEPIARQAGALTCRKCGKTRDNCACSDGHGGFEFHA